MGKIKKILTMIVTCTLLVGCAFNNASENQRNEKEEIKSHTDESVQKSEDKKAEDNKATNLDLFADLEIEKYVYSTEFEVDNNLQLLLENMAIYYKHYNSDETMEAEDESAFIKNFCQNSWFCFDYIYESLDKSEGIINKQQIEYIQYSLSGNYVEFQSIDDDYEVDVNDCSSGFVYAELASYKVISDEEEIVIEADFNISDNSTEKANVTLVKNEYSCFDGYSVKTFDVFEE
ncbi:hypothetical protein [Pseudobutyrivibrio sp.]|uniref:hypothetical protein n=1 Tax=Pseudobutyrivibrio sp. TaxID=2014367 RepID=UPI001D1C1607|nr:hypothetical protein [Pseudobutyrivibrio sp.]MBE5910380.1 hypothetical protein [Pseudobutyrivibrio sp.]